MGKQGWGAKNSGGHQGGQNYGYKFWRGAWPRQEPPSTAFPAYDSRRGQDWARTDMEAETPSLVNMFQSAINYTRKMEQRVVSVSKNKTERAALWRKYEADMKLTYAKEFSRFQKDMERIEADLTKALADQEEARQALLRAHSGQPPPAKAEEERVDRMFAEWRQGEMSDAQGVLHRAIAAQTTVPPTRGPGHAGPGMDLPAFGRAPPGLGGMDVDTDVHGGHHASGHTEDATMPPMHPPNVQTFPGPPMDPAAYVRAMEAQMLEHAAAHRVEGPAPSTYPGPTTSDPYMPSPGAAFLKCRPASHSPSARVNPYGSLKTMGEAEAVPTIPAAAPTAEPSLVANLAATRALKPFGGAAGTIPNIDPAKPGFPAIVVDDKDELSLPDEPADPGGTE